MPATRAHAMVGPAPAHRRWEVAVGRVAAAAGVALFLVAPRHGPSDFVGGLRVPNREAGIACWSYDTETELRQPVQRSDPHQRWAQAVRRKEQAELSAEVPWPRHQTELMVDAMSVIRHYRTQEKVNEYGQVIEDDPHSFWPARVYCALRPLVQHYGLDVPPSPWKPVVCVYDIPNPSKTRSGLKVRKWGNLHKQGPRSVGRGECGPGGAELTLAWAQTYVDQSAAERYRCDKEILWMLEVLTRDMPRRQVLVTGDRWLQREAKRFCLVRDVNWLEQEILGHGEEGEKAIAPLQGDTDDIQFALKGLPPNIKRAFTVY